ncbi:mevalonate kinase family protein [Tellurirhabdus rosea]|uniref:mevalonate kinase family protein n=1 Tax=Tellurirhabdus rosea TaxID=2674997 RepID=UPI00225796C4|nr:galactokinase family protein [Tellurirhabdus rosea]
MNALTASTPGRICLFGEHLDYLGLPVIAAAISRRVSITGTRRADRHTIIELPDIRSRVEFDFTDEPLAYGQERDYFRSAYNVLLKHDFTFSKGVEGTVRGNIPLNSGTSSSTALVTSWIHFLVQMSDRPRPLSRRRVAELAHEAEVQEFGEPGGTMDHYATALGNVIYLETEPAVRIEELRPKLGAFVLGDSQEPKDTIGILRRVRNGVQEIVRKVQELNPDFSLHLTDTLELDNFSRMLSEDEFRLLSGTVANRDLLREARQVLEAADLNHVRLGELLTQHQNVLRTAQQISTPKIDRMIDAALGAGALGAKINGSGGGGCMFAYAPGHAASVAEAIEREGGLAYIINIDQGTLAEPTVIP